MKKKFIVPVEIEIEAETAIEAENKVEDLLWRTQYAIENYFDEFRYGCYTVDKAVQKDDIEDGPR